MNVTSQKMEFNEKYLNTIFSSEIHCMIQCDYNPLCTAMVPVSMNVEGTGPFSCHFSVVRDFQESCPLDQQPTEKIMTNVNLMEIQHTKCEKTSDLLALKQIECSLAKERQNFLFTM